MNIEYPAWMYEHARTFVAVCNLYCHSINYNNLAIALHGDDEGYQPWGYYIEFARRFVLNQ